MGEPEYYCQADSPLGRRLHLSLVRSGKLEGFKVGRRVLVRRETMRAFVEKYPVKGHSERVTAADILAGKF